MRFRKGLYYENVIMTNERFLIIFQKGADRSPEKEGFS